MKFFFTLLVFLCATIFYVNGQTTTQPAGEEAFGKIDKADLEMKSCVFEKDANAEVLFDVEDLIWGHIYRHTRIKIFNEKGTNQGNIKIQYFGGTNLEHITDLKAVTFNLVNGEIVTTKLDNKQIHKQIIDKLRSAMVFSMPDVKQGSVIDVEYTVEGILQFYPSWFFQNVIPVRYSELNTNVSDILSYTEQIRTRQPFFKHEKIWGNSRNNENTQFDQMVMINIPSLTDEPKMTSVKDNLESIIYYPTGVLGVNLFNTWQKIGKIVDEDDDFGAQLNRKLSDEKTIVDQAKNLNTENDKICYVFDKVRDLMKWNSVYSMYTYDGTYKAWNNKTGNSSEINIILYHLLTESGVKACPMLVSTRGNGEVNPAYTSLDQFNSAVVFVPLNADSTNFYILDATGKYNSYNQIPENLLNSYGLCVDKENKKFNIVSLVDSLPVKKSILINGTITPDGELSGKTDISDFGYNRTKSLDLYNTGGSEKFIDYLTNNNNNIKVSDLKLENTNVDSLPLTEKFNFKVNLTPDNNYIYFNPNLFSSLYSNPFLSPNRVSDIDFGYQDDYLITGIYTLPAGYSVDALPKSLTIVMPDNSITFKRFVIQQGETIMVRYYLVHKKTIYFKENYADFYGFYKKLYELLNEQIVLKKS